MELGMSDREVFTLTVTLSDREDGGVRVSSSDLPGLILSGKDKKSVIESVTVAAVALLEHRGLMGVTVTPTKSIGEILDGKNPQDLDMHVQHFIVEYRKAA